MKTASSQELVKILTFTTFKDLPIRLSGFPLYSVYIDTSESAGPDAVRDESRKANR
jgi:hypothetical protein